MLKLKKPEELLPESASCSSIAHQLPVTEVAIIPEQESNLQGQQSDEEDEPNMSALKIVSSKSEEEKHH